MTPEAAQTETHCCETCKYFSESHWLIADLCVLYGRDTVAESTCDSHTPTERTTDDPRTE